jgi:hypothetical protein
MRAAGKVISVVLLLALAGVGSARADEKVTYADNVLPLLRNTCLNCHNPDKKKGGLDLSTYSTAMSGGGSGKAIEPGDPDASLLYRLVTHADEPTMPPKSAKLPDKELDVIKRWIAGGALENSGSTAVVSAKPKLDLKVQSATTRPSGPPPMPGDLLLEPPVHTARAGAVLAMATSPWAPLVAVGGQKQVLLYHTQTRELLGVLPFPEGFPNVLKFSRSGKLLLVAGGVGAKSGKAVLFDVTTGDRVTEVGDELDAVLAADVSPDQSLVALGGPAKVVKLYSTANGAMTDKIKKHTDWVTAISFSPDGKLLATGDRNGGVCVWEAESAQEFRTLPGHKAAVTDMAFRADSSVLATCGEDGDVKLWDIASGKALRSIKAHDGAGVLSLDFAPDGRLATAGRDKRVKFWRANGNPIKTSKDFRDIALHVAFDNSDDGRRAVAADWTGEIRVIDAEEPGKSLGALEANPPGIEERLSLARAKVNEVEGAASRASADLFAARVALRSAAEAVRSTDSALASLRDSLAGAEAKLREAGVNLAADVAGNAFAEVARKARDIQRRFEGLSEKMTRAGAAVQKLKAISAEKSSQAEALKQEIARLQAGQFFTQVYAARQALRAQQREADVADAEAKAAQAAAEQAVADVPAFEKRIADFPQTIATAERNLPLAKQTATAAANLAKGLAEIAAEREAFAKASNEHAGKVAELAAKSPSNKLLADAAAAAQSSADLLAAELERMKQSVKSQDQAAKAAGDAYAAAQADVEKRKLEQKTGAQTLETLRAAIPKAQATAVEKKSVAEAATKKLEEVKAKVQQLDAQYAGMKKQLGLASAQ